MCKVVVGFTTNMLLRSASVPTLLTCTHVQMLVSMFWPWKHASARYCPIAVAAVGSVSTLAVLLQTCRHNSNPSSSQLQQNKGSEQV
jgi:hypothetical protein